MRFDCTNEKAMYSSLKEILGVTWTTVDKFVEDNFGKIIRERNCTRIGEIEIDDFLRLISGNNFKCEELMKSIKFDYLCIFHLSAILDETSYKNYGILSLSGLFEYDNAIKKCLKKFNV